MAISLDALRAAVLENQARGETQPDDPTRQVVVDKTGGVHLASDVKPGDPITKVPQEVFAGGDL